MLATNPTHPHTKMLARTHAAGADGTWEHGIPLTNTPTVYAMDADDGTSSDSSTPNQGDRRPPSDTAAPGPPQAHATADRSHHGATGTASANATRNVGPQSVEGPSYQDPPIF